MRQPLRPGRRTVAVVTILLAGSIAPLVSAGTGTGHPTAAVDDETLHRHWEASVVGYRLLTLREPDNGMAWFRLGTALENVADPAGAVVAFSHARALGFEPAAAGCHMSWNRRLLEERRVRRHTVVRGGDPDLGSSMDDEDDPEPRARARPAGLPIAAPCSLLVQQPESGSSD